MKLWMTICSVLLLGACAAYSGYGLKPGEDRLENVLQVMGKPAMRWKDAEGAEQLAFTRGPMGYHTFMVFVGSDGKLQSIENVMNEKNFARIQNGMSKDEVLHILGPSITAWTVDFKSLNELVWEWRYCDAWNEAARFNVVFDDSKATVRTTLSHTESQLGLWGKGNHWCSH